MLSMPRHCVPVSSTPSKVPASDCRHANHRPRNLLYQPLAQLCYDLEVLGYSIGEFQLFLDGESRERRFGPWKTVIWRLLEASPGTALN